MRVSFGKIVGIMLFMSVPVCADGAGHDAGPASSSNEPQPATMPMSESGVPKEFLPALNAKELRLGRQGRSYPPCIAFLANMNMQEYPGRALGDWPILIKDPLFKKPDWQNLNPREHKYILVQIFLAKRAFLLERHPNEPVLTDEQIEAQIESGISQEDILLQRAVMRFNGDPYPDEVFRYTTARNKPTILQPSEYYWMHYVKMGDESGGFREVGQRGGMFGPADLFIYDKDAYLITGTMGSYGMAEAGYSPSANKAGGMVYACMTDPIITGEVK